MGRSGVAIPPAAWVQIKRLYLMAKPNGKKRFSDQEIADAVNRDFSTMVHRSTIQARAGKERWGAERRALFAKAHSNVYVSKKPPSVHDEANTLPEPGPVTRPDGKPYRGGAYGAASQRTIVKADVTDESLYDDAILRTRLAVVTHMEAYLGKTKVVTEKALESIELALNLHAKAANKVVELLGHGMDILDDKVQAYQKVMLSPVSLAQIAKLGQLLQANQLNVVLNDNRVTNNQTLILSWDDSYPPPPMPPMPVAQADQDSK